MNLEEYCCVCVKKVSQLESVNKTNGHQLSYLHQLLKCAPNRRWNQDFNICQECIEKLVSTYDFIQTCEIGEKLREEQKIHQSKSIFSEDFCCVCIENDLLTENIYEKNGRYLNHQHKLSICVRNQKWTKDLEICKKCIEKLESAYDFMQTCQLSEELRKEQLLLLAEQNYSGKKIDTIEFVYECDECHLQFPSEWGLNVHNRIHKRQFINDMTEEEQQQLVESGEDFKIESGRILKKEVLLLKGRSNLAPKSRVGCEYCGKVITWENYSAHVRRKHTFEDLYECDLCDAKYAKSNELLIHKRKHTKERPYICSYCGKTFDNQGSLHHHNKIHLNKRQYQCKECGRRYNTTSCLTAHKIHMHTDREKWKYTCSNCSMKFPVSGNLLRHMKRHRGVKDHSCHICDRKFYDLPDLRYHLKSHSFDRLFKCTICNNDYKHRKGLLHHMRIKHNLAKSELPSQKKEFSDHDESENHSNSIIKAEDISVEVKVE